MILCQRCPALTDRRPFGKIKPSAEQTAFKNRYTLPCSPHAATMTHHDRRGHPLTAPCAPTHFGKQMNICRSLNNVIIHTTGAQCNENLTPPRAFWHFREKKLPFFVQFRHFSITAIHNINKCVIDISQNCRAFPCEISTTCPQIASSGRGIITVTKGCKTVTNRVNYRLKE